LTQHDSETNGALPSDSRTDPTDVDALLKAEDADGLAVLAKSEHKPTAKAARRALYLLGKRGIVPHAPEEDRPVSGAVRQPSAPRCDAAIMTLSDDRGNRIVAMGRSMRARRISTFVLDTVSGAVEKATVLDMTLDEFLQEPDGQPRQQKPEAARIPPEYAYLVIRQAVETIRRDHLLPPFGLAQALAELGEADSSLTETPIYQLIKPASVTALSESPDERYLWLFRKMAGLFDEGAVAEMVQDADRALHSPLVLTPVQTREKLDRLYASYADRLLPPARRKAAVRQFEDDALVCYYMDRQSDAETVLGFAEAGRHAQTAAEWNLVIATARLTTLAALAKDTEDDDRGEEEKDGPIIHLTG
jgi:hypothetical protein